MSKCLDCGCLLDCGICSNCHEATFIQTFQSDDMAKRPSKDFINQVAKEKQEIKNRNKIIRTDPEVFKDLEKSDNYYKK